jgi:putative membrane protein
LTTHWTPKAFLDNKPLQLMIGWQVFVWVLAAYEPLQHHDWLLENMLVFAYSSFLVLSYRYFAFSNLSYFLYTIFITMHLMGAHYTYAQTPFGFWLQDMMGTNRNNYDRLVHFSYGLLIAYPFREALIRAANIRVGWSYFVAVCGILAFSAFYEVLEAMVAIIVTPELGVLWLGAQGDEWDAQKDTALAGLGATLAMIICWAMVKLGRRSVWMKS